MLWIFQWGKVWNFLLNLERETGIEPATNGLGSRYSTIELLPLRLPLYCEAARSDQWIYMSTFLFLMSNAPHWRSRI